MEKEIRVKVQKKFLSPLTNRLTEVGDEMNVPLSRFWLRRLEQKDCEKVKKVKPKLQALSHPKLKGSK